MNKGLLVVSFGTSVSETRKKTIEAIEAELAAAFPERRTYRAWTSGIIRKKLLRTENLAIDSVEEALERMLADGITDLLVQPTHMLPGAEFAKAEAALREYAPRFGSVSLGKPLLSDEADVRRMAGILEDTFYYVPPAELLALMGHGSETAEPNVYLLLNEAFDKDGYRHFRVGTVEATPGFAPITEAAKERKPTRIHLLPFLVVAGDHALNDMAGEEADSWASRLRSRGYEVDCILRGLGEYPKVRAAYVEHAKRAEALR